MNIKKELSHSPTHERFGTLNLPLNNNKLLNIIQDLLDLNSVEDLSYIMRHAIRELIPHEISVCGTGDIKSKCVYSLHNFGYPERFLRDITTKNDNNLVVNSPVVDASFNSQLSFIEVNDTLSFNTKYEQWTESAKKHKIKNILAVAQFHPGSRLASYFCFTNHSKVEQRHYQLIKILMPFLDQAIFSLREQNDNADKFKLSIREIQILSALNEGASNKEIARQYNISDQTVRHHISRILKKMSANNRTQALALALSSGIVEN